MPAAIDFYFDFSSPYGFLASQKIEALAKKYGRTRRLASVEQAMARGVFGSPYMIVDGEPFWGLDRLDQIERWLATGGF